MFGSRMHTIIDIPERHYYSPKLMCKLYHILILIAAIYHAILHGRVLLDILGSTLHSGTPYELSLESHFYTLPSEPQNRDLHSRLFGVRLFGVRLFGVRLFGVTTIVSISGFQFRSLR